MLQGWSSCVLLIGSPPQGPGFRSKVNLGFLTGKLEDPEMTLHSRDDISRSVPEEFSLELLWFHWFQGSRTGPSLDPCGTPIVNATKLESVWSTWSEPVSPQGCALVSATGSSHQLSQRQHSDQLVS